MWKLMGSPKTVKITKQLIKEYHELEPAPGDRFLNDRRAEKLKGFVTAKNFRPVVWAKVHCKETGAWYRVNGKHTSQVMSELNGETNGLFAHVELYEADGLEDVARLYATFDSRVSARSSGDIYRSYSHAIPEVACIPQAILTSALSGLAFSVWGVEYTKKTTPEQRAELLSTNTSFVLWFAQICTGVPNKDRNAIRRVPVAGAMHKTWEKDRKAATEFWTAVRDATGTKNTAPDRRLNKFLLTTSINSARTGRGAGSGVATSHEMYVRCVHAWNAWRRGASTDLKYFPNASDPKVI